MTTIAMLEHSAGVTIGFDSKVVLNGNSAQMSHPKVVVNNGLIFGSAGDLLRINVLQHADLPDPADIGWDVDRWVNNELIPAMLDAFEERAMRQSNGVGGTTLAVVRGRVYQIDFDGSWLRRSDNIYCIGSGSEFTRGALDARANLHEALEIAARHDNGTGYDITVTQSTQLLYEGTIA